MIFNNGNKRIALKDVEFHHCNFLYEKYKHSVVEIVFNNDDGVCMNGRDCHNLCPFSYKSNTKRAKLAEVLEDDLN